MEKIIQKQYVQDNASLVELCNTLAKSDLLAIDTEFVRTRTLYPKLGLLQVSNGDIIALIDPVTIDDLSPFWALLTNEHICKVLHACSEDLEVFLTAANCKPINLIDSQVMMSFLGHGLSLGYAATVQQFTGVELDKSESRTDWIKRPLTQRQLTYAEADVEYLYQIFPQIHQLVDDAGWLLAAKQETQLMIDRKFTPINEDLMYMNIKMNWKLDAQQLNTLKHLATWRYQQAKKRDMPLGFIAKEQTLITLALRNPTCVSTMLGLEGVEMLDVKHRGKAMLQVLIQASKTPEDEYPQIVIRLDEYPAYKQIFKQVKTFVASAAKEAELLPENLASKKQINQFLSFHFKINNAEKSKGVVDILHSWRLTLFGEKLQNFANNDFK